MFKKQALLPIFVSILVAIVYIILAIQFKDMYQSFGAVIPVHTTFILQNYWVLALSPIATIVAIYLTGSGTNERRFAVIISLLTTICIWLFVSWSLYSPLSQLGE
jgi:uncharacterized membrane protein